MRTAFLVVSETLKKLVDDTLGADFLFDFSLMFEEVGSYQSNGEVTSGHAIVLLWVINVVAFSLYLSRYAMRLAM